jgi:hypothetical protein
MSGHVRLFVAVITLAFTGILAACVESENDDRVGSVPDSAVAENETPTAEVEAPTPVPDPTSTPAVTPDRDEDRLPYWHRWWDEMDFDTAIVPLEEIQSGGVPPDGIPPIDEPKFVTYSEADNWLGDQEPVISIEIEDEARAYPLQILTWHEIVNDEFGERAIGVTFCPLCNAAVAFDREVGDHGIMRFGVSGLLRNSDLIMWDDKTKSWWQQMTGEAIVGELAGEQLTLLPSVIVSYEEFKQSHPDAVVLSRDTGFERVYGNNPYVGYDDIASSPFLFSGEQDGRYPPMERVLTLEIAGEPKAYPFSLLEEHPVVHDEVGGKAVVVFWSPGATSALDQTSIADSREVGSANAFKLGRDAESRTFVFENGEILDEQTRSTWNVLGHATDGELAGERLDELLTGTHFWFAWAAFQPETSIWEP